MQIGQVGLTNPSKYEIRSLPLTCISIDYHDHECRTSSLCTRCKSSLPVLALLSLTQDGSPQILGGIADTVAQSLTAIRQKAVRQPGGIGKDNFVAIEIHELDRKIPYSAGELIPSSKYLPPPFDFERLTRFMSYGFIMAPVQFHWFAFLSTAFPITKVAGLAPALKRVAFDQLIFAPAGTSFRLRQSYWVTFASNI